jgi:hypothetical protein
MKKRDDKSKDPPLLSCVYQAVHVLCATLIPDLIYAATQAYDPNKRMTWEARSSIVVLITKKTIRNVFKIPRVTKIFGTRQWWKT